MWGRMHPETQLAIAAAFAGFLLKTFLGFCICWTISRADVSPRRSFLVWFAFLFIAGCYWLALILSFVPYTSSEFSLSVHALASSAPVATWQMQPSWAYPLLVVERVLGALYLIALGNFLVVRIKKQLRLRWVLRFAYKAPEQTENMFRSIAIDAGTEKVRLLVLSGIYSPATFGWIHPVVLLPPLCLEQDESELTDIFRHELQHVVRHDFLFNNLAGLCRAILFFHPALWYAMRRLELESELACDLAVVRNSPERRATYAECLVRFARLHAAQQPTPWGLDFAGSSIQLKVRVRSVLTETAKLPAWILGLRTSMGLLLVAGFLCMAPSLCIVLSYAHGVVPLMVPPIISSRAAMRSRKRSLIPVPERQNLTRSIVTPATPTVVDAATHRSEASLEPAARLPQQPDTLPSGEPVPTLQQRGDAATSSKPARATVIFISNPSSDSAGSAGATKRRSIASAVITGAGEAARFTGSHGKDIH
jgi:beta-lactamase regulating signal transducer with metallopeptidase domain